jgi:DnaJ-class molecular chaperone
MTCPKCQGHGTERIPLPHPKRGYSVRKCVRCGGTGTWIREPGDESENEPEVTEDLREYLRTSKGN